MTKSIRLGDFILINMESILEQWEDFASTINPPALTMDSHALRDHAELMLKTIAYDLSTKQTEYEQVEKSKGLAPTNFRTTAAEAHAEERLSAGFTIGQLVSEYRALRASVLHLWDKNSAEGLLTDAVDITRFNEAIDQTIAESVERFLKLLKTSQDIFLGILGHDLRNPLATSLASTSMVLNYEDISQKVRSNALRTYTSLQRMNNLITDLMQYTGSHLGKKLPIVIAPTNMGMICMDIIEEHQVVHPERQIVTEMNGCFDGNWDEQKMGQVISNLLGNAIENSVSSSSIGVNVSSTPHGVSIKINNQGKPIPKSEIKHIFEPMTRHLGNGSEDNSLKTSLGLGLYIVSEIVQAHKGTINVTSTKEKGTTFEIIVPY